MNQISKILLILFLSTLTTFSQENLSSISSKIADFVSSPDFYKIRLEQGDVIAVDSIYSFANSISNDKSENLLAITFSLLAFDKMKLRFPKFTNGSILFLPETDIINFNNKLENLPRYLFFDSPQSSNGDIDKVSHFFGNAFLGYNLNSFNFNNFLGIFVEVFEASLKKNGHISDRDLRTNDLGFLFGRYLRENRKLRPSFFFIFERIKFFGII